MSTGAEVEEGTMFKVPKKYVTPFLIAILAVSSMAIAADLNGSGEVFVPENVAMRTAANRLNVSQVGRVGAQEPGNEMTWFSDGTDYLFDGSLIIGYDADHMFTNIFYQEGTRSPRELVALSHTDGDSTSYPYRFAEGNGCTADSTIGFTSRFYAAKHPDSSGFYIAHFDVYAGPAWTSTISGVSLSYAADWNVPSDTGFNNSPGFVQDEQLVYQKGEYVGSPAYNDNRYAGLAYRGDDLTNETAGGGFVWNSAGYVYPDNGYDADSLVKYIAQTATTSYFTLEIDTLPITDYSTVLVCQRDVSITDVDTTSFSVIIAATNPNAVKSEADLVANIRKAEKFICCYVVPDAPFCNTGPQCLYGDADSNGIINISDAVYIIAYIFGGGSAPNPLCNGDCDENGLVNIADAVCLISIIFPPFGDY
jgi:hypothetical protein